MGQYVSQSGFAKLAGVSRQAITQAVKEGRVECCKLGIDPEHPTNRYYLNASRANTPRNTDRGLQQKPRSIPKAVKAKRVVDITALAEGLMGGELDDYLSALSKPSTDRLKVVEQIKALRLKTDERRRTLVPRETIRRVFSRLLHQKAVPYTRLHPQTRIPFRLFFKWGRYQCINLVAGPASDKLRDR